MVSACGDAHFDKLLRSSSLRCRGSLFWSPGGAPRLILRNVFGPTSRWVSACPHPRRVVFSSLRVLVDALRSFESLYTEFISIPRGTRVSLWHPLIVQFYFRRRKWRHLTVAYTFLEWYDKEILSNLFKKKKLSKQYICDKNRLAIASCTLSRYFNSK